jgi:hypothetical protein
VQELPILRETTDYYIEKIFKDSSGYNIPEDAKALTQVGEDHRICRDPIG